MFNLTTQLLAADLQQLVTQTEHAWYVNYFWPLLAWLIAPLVAAAATQRIKNGYKKLKGVKPHWLFLDIFAFILCGILAGLFWRMKFPSLNGIILVGITVSTLQTTLIKILFVLTDKFFPKMAEELKHSRR